MALRIATVIPKGIVLVVENRLFYVKSNKFNKKRLITTEEVSNIFELNRQIGVITAEGGLLSKNTKFRQRSDLFAEFKREISGIQDLSVKETSEKLHQFIESKYDWKKRLKEMFEILKNYHQKRGCETINFELDGYPGRIEYEDDQGNLRDQSIEVEEIEFILAGYNEDGSPEIYECNIFRFLIHIFRFLIHIFRFYFSNWSEKIQL